MKYLFTLIVFLIFAFPSSGQNPVDPNKINKDYLDLIRNMKNDMENLKDENESLLRKLESLTSNQKSIAQVKAELAREAREKESVPEGRSTEDILSELDEKEAELEKLVRAKRAVERGKEAAEKKNSSLNKKVKQSEKDRVAAELEAEQNKNFLYGLAMATMFIFFLAALFYNRFRVNKKAKNSLQETNRQIDEERKRSDELLLNILPEPIANELKENGKASAQKYENVTVLFTDFKDFTKVSERLTPEQLVRELDYCFRGFDFIISQYGVEKIKTIGDAYMCASGLTNKRTMPVNIIKAGLEMQEFLEDYKKERMVKGLPFFEARIGIHTGPVVAGVVGVKKFAYDIWGDTVNIAARMEANAGVGKVNISEETYRQVRYNFDCEHRGKIEAKNKGFIDMYHVKQPVPVAS
ncbi:MAG: adenylate/guanylate cyclase domain-containing protein [Saprospiraceae bacterium]